MHNAFEYTIRKSQAKEMNVETLNGMGIGRSALIEKIMNLQKRS